MLMCGGKWESGDSLEPVDTTTLDFCGPVDRYGNHNDSGDFLKLKMWNNSRDGWVTVFIKRSEAETLGLALIKA